MIRVLILAESLLRAHTLAEALKEDDRLDIVDVRAVSASLELLGPVDVILSVGLPPARVRRWGEPIVALADESIIGRSLHACLPADSPAATVAAALAAASHDLILLTRQQAKTLLPPAEVAAVQYTEVETLTPRELQVLQLLASGLANKQLAQQLGISDHTAKFHVAQILAKLGAATRTQAVSIAIRRGLIPL